SYRTFKKLTDALVGLRLIERKMGYRRVTRFEVNDPWLPHFARATRFRATDQLLASAKTSGITRENVESHFIKGLPESADFKKYIQTLFLWGQAPRKADEVQSKRTNPPCLF